MDGTRVEILTEEKIWCGYLVLQHSSAAAGNRPLKTTMSTILEPRTAKLGETEAFNQF